MRVVLDTNVLARPSYRPDGPAAEVLDRVSQAPHVLIISAFILSELDRVLRYPRFRRVHGLTDQEIDSYVVRVGVLGLIVGPPSTVGVPVVATDPADDPIILTAVDGRAEVICTLDRHFRHPDVQVFCASHGIRIMSDVELLQILRIADGQ